MSAAQRIKFKGVLTNGTAIEEKVVDVLAGEGGVTPVDGWSKWAKVPRWGRTSLTVMEGYEPLALQVPVLFDAVIPTDPPYDVEKEIQDLEWMGGRGFAYGQPDPPGGVKPSLSGPTPGSKPKKGGSWVRVGGKPVKVGQAGVGESPLITLFAEDGHNHESHLVPAQFQWAALRWVIDGNRGAISFDSNPLRDAKGNRIRQAATVNLTQFIASPGSGFDSVSTRLKAIMGVDGFYTTPTHGNVDTIAKIVQQEMVRWSVSPAHRSFVQREVVKANPKLGTNPNKKLKNGTPVKIPNKALSTVLV